MTEERFEELYDKLFASMLGYCHGKHPFLDSESIVQNTFRTFWSKRDTIDENNNPEGLLWGILKNGMHTKLRSSARNIKKLSLLKLTIEPSQAVEGGDLIEFLSQVKLTKKERELYDLAFVKGLTGDETSRILKISKSNVYLKIHRLRKNIKEQRKAFYDD